MKNKFYFCGIKSNSAVADDNKKMNNVFTIEPDGTVNFLSGNSSTEVTGENSERLFKELRYTLHVRQAISEASDDLQAAIKSGDDDARDDAIRRLNEARNRLGELNMEFEAKKQKVNEEARFSRQLDNGILTSVAAFFEVFLKTRKRLIAMKPEDLVDVNKKEFLEAFRGKTQEQQARLLEEAGATFSKEGDAAVATAAIEEKERDVLVIVYRDADGIQGHVVFEQPEQLEAFKEDNKLTEKLRGCTEIDFFTIPYSEYQKNSAMMAVAEDKKAFAEGIPGSVRHTQFSRSRKVAQIESEEQKAESAQGQKQEAAGPSKTSEAEKKLEKKSPDLKALNKKITAAMMPFYEKGRSEIDPRKVDWSAFIAQGINVEKLSDDDKRRLLDGRRTGMTEALKLEDDGRISRRPCKVRIKEERGLYVPLVSPKYEKLSIPDEFLGHKFSPEEKEQLIKNGVLKETIQVNVASHTMNILPFVEPDLNSVTFRNFDRLVIPDKTEGMEISSEAKKKLLSSRVATVTLTDGGRRTAGYARINPVNGNLEAVHSPFAGIKAAASASIDITSEKTEQKTSQTVRRSAFKL